MKTASNRDRKAWSDRKVFRSAGVDISFRYSEKFHKKIFPFSPPINISITGHT